MELLRSNLYVFSETSPNNGKWIISNTSLNADGTLEVQIDKEDKATYHLSSNITIQSPNDSVWHRTPPLPFRRSVKETLSLQVKKSAARWFLFSSEEERNKWFKTLTSFTNRQPPPYGDYDNWTYSHLDSETKPQSTRAFHPRKSLTPTHRSGFYSIHEPRNVSREQRHSGIYSVQAEPSEKKFPELSLPQNRSGFYSVQDEPRRGSGRFADVGLPQNRSGFYSVQSKEKEQGVKIKPEQPPERVGCCENLGCCCGCFACIVEAFGACLQICCLNFAAAV